MNKLCFSVFIMFFLCLQSCVSIKPKDFTYRYSNDMSAGLDRLIDIDGYYISQRECDSTFHSIFMFYPDGLFVIATGTDLSRVIECLENDNFEPIISKYLSWGLYHVEGNVVKTQTIRQEGIALYTVFRDYEVMPEGTLLNTSDYVYPENAKIGYLKDYPSFRENKCNKSAVFFPLKNKRPVSECPYINRKWFKKNR